MTFFKLSKKHHFPWIRLIFVTYPILVVVIFNLRAFLNALCLHSAVSKRAYKSLNIAVARIAKIIFTVKKSFLGSLNSACKACCALLGMRYLDWRRNKRYKQTFYASYRLCI